MNEGQPRSVGERASASASSAGAKIDVIRPVFVDSAPEPDAMERGVVYVSAKYAVAIHLCAGGCDSQVVMSLQPDWSKGWTMQRDGDALTFSPSILQKPCGHHYFIEQNHVRWA